MCDTGKDDINAGDIISKVWYDIDRNYKDVKEAESEV